MHRPLPDLNLPTHNEWAVHILVPRNTASKAGDTTARVTKQLTSSTVHYDRQTPKIIITHITGHNNYYLHTTHERPPINIYTFTTYLDLKQPRRHPRPEWGYLLHFAPAPRKRPTQHAPPPADSSALQAACTRAAAQHHNNLLPHISPRPSVTESTEINTVNLLARGLRP